MGQLTAAAAAIGVGGMLGQDSADANFVDILNSRTTRQDVLSTVYQFKARSWRFGPEKTQRLTLYAYLESKNMDRAVKKMTDIITTLRDQKTKVITLSAETKSPELSQQIVKRALQDLELFVLEKGRTKGGEKANFSAARLAESRVEKAKAQETFQHFIEGNRNYQTSTDPAVRLTGANLETELKLRQQLVLTLAMNYEQSLLEEKNDIPIVNILDDPNLPIEKSNPLRSVIILLSFILSVGGYWAWFNQKWIQARLWGEDFPSGAETNSEMGHR